MPADTEVKWSGTFIRKSLAPAVFIPLSQMTAENWRLLDFENLRTVAKNQIAETAATHDLIGFVHVTFTKGSMGRGYLESVTSERLAEIMDTGDIGLINRPDSGVPTLTTQQLENTLQAMKGMPLLGRLALLAWLIGELLDDEEEEKAQQVLDVAGGVDVVELAEPDQNLRDALMVLWTENIEDLEELVLRFRADAEEISDESDERDELEDLIRVLEERLQEIKAKGRLAAAGG